MHQYASYIQTENGRCFSCRYPAKVLLEHPSPSIGCGWVTWTPAWAWNSWMMTLFMRRFGSAWNKARMGSNRFMTAQKSNAMHALLYISIMSETVSFTCTVSNTADVWMIRSMPPLWNSLASFLWFLLLVSFGFESFNILQDINCLCLRFVPTCLKIHPHKKRMLYFRLHFFLQAGFAWNKNDFRLFWYIIV